MAAVSTKRRRPQQPLWPAPGTYDPTIKLSAATAQRGLGDLQVDYTRDYGEPGTAFGGRQGADYLTAKNLTARGSGRQLADVLLAGQRGEEDFGIQRGQIDQQYHQSLADLLTGRQRGQEDHTTALQGLDRRYTQMANQQGQSFRAAGLRGGAQIQAAEKRATNRGIEQAPLDTSFSRFLSDSQLSEGRLGTGHQQALDALDLAHRRFLEDQTASQGRLGEDKQAGLDDLSTNYLRGGEDASTQLARAGRENAAFQLGSQKQAIYQAGPAFQPVAGRRKKRRR